MVAAVETMAYAGETPWHGLGNKTSNTRTPRQMCADGGVNWTVSKQPMAIKATGKDVPQEYALCRDTDGQFLSIVGAKYKPVQNEEAMDFFKKFVEAGHMSMETVGSLWNGRYVWGLARIGKDFKIGKDDEVRGYLLLASPHVRGRALVIMHTMVRVVCWNTLCMALGYDLKGGPGAFRMPHTLKFDDQVKQRAEEALGLATTQTEQMRDAVQLLSKKRITEAKVKEYFCDVLKFDPKAAKQKKDGSLVEPRMLPKFVEALSLAPGQDLAGSKGTLWGAVNAVTYVVDHETGRGDRSTALRNAWLGHTAGIKRHAFELALERAK